MSKEKITKDNTKEQKVEEVKKKKKFKTKNIMLHAHKIKFMINNIKYNFEAKYGKEFEQFIKKKF